MMTSKRFLSGMTAVLLAFALVLTACESPLTDGGTVGISSLDAPKVAATVKKGGVLLEWSPILDASSYAVWRKATAGNEEPVRLNGNFSQIQATGKYRYIDLVSDTNELKVNTEYTYTVTASGGSKTTAKTEVKATPTDIPAKGTKLAAVSEVTLKLDQEA
ncbi:MAG: hypothetical protein LBD79_02985, partial [Treponema sp.]|nr:hypothetical protein [Treponema sp.]